MQSSLLWCYCFFSSFWATNKSSVLAKILYGQPIKSICPWLGSETCRCLKWETGEREFLPFSMFNFGVGSVSLPSVTSSQFLHLRQKWSRRVHRDCNSPLSSSLPDWSGLRIETGAFAERKKTWSDATRRPSHSQLICAGLQDGVLITSSGRQRLERDVQSIKTSGEDHSREETNSK